MEAGSTAGPEADAGGRPAICVLRQRRCCWDLPEQALPSSGQPVVCLTQRELEIIQLVALGYKSRETAARLGLRPATVHTYLHSIRNKLHMQRRAELVRFALKAGLLEEQASDRR